MIDSKSLKELLNENLKNLDVYVYESVTSTNDLAKEFAQQNPNKEAVIIASMQTNGRGRYGRSFFSPNKTGLYISIILRPTFSPQVTSLLTPYTALCVAKSINAISDKKTEIKWVNDVYIDGKKVSGILCESAFSPDKNLLQYVVVGIGINLSNPVGDFPDELKDIATTVFGNTKPNKKTSEKLTSLIINYLFEYPHNLENRRFIEEYKKMLCMLDCDVEVISPNESYIARAVDIDDDARLIVSLSDGSKKPLDSGEISIRRKKE